MTLQDDDSLCDGDDPDESDQDAGDEAVQTLPCPRCGGEIYEDADRCPRCGEYVVAGQRASGSLWRIVAAVMALLAVLLWLIA